MEEKTVQKIDNLIETLSKNLEKNIKEGRKSTDEIKALAELITARASVKPIIGFRALSDSQNIITRKSNLNTRFKKLKTSKL